MNPVPRWRAFRRALALVALLAPPVAVPLAGAARAMETPSDAPEGVEHIHDLYSAYLGGFPLADFSLDFRDDAAGYKADLVLESRGMLEVFKKLRAQARGRGSWESEGSPLSSLHPSLYERVYRNTTQAGLREIRYPKDPDAPPRGYNNGEEDDRVPPDLRMNSYDPFAIFAAGRRLLRETAPGETVRLPVFDGKLRYTFIATVEEPRVREINGKPVAIRPVRLEPVPVSGFSKKHARSWEGKVLKLDFSDDGNFRPVRFELTNAFGGFVITRIGACDDPDVSCPTPLPRYLPEKNREQ